MSAYAELDAEYLADAGEESTSAPTPVPMLPPYFGEEASSRDWEIARQRRAIRQWFERNALFAFARREIAARRAAAFEAEGLI